MRVRIGALALVGLLGALASSTVVEGPLASAVLSGTSATTTATTATTTTSAGTTSGATTTAGTTTVPTAPPRVVAPAPRQIDRGCTVAGGVMLLLPGRRPLVLGPLAEGLDPRITGAGAFVYPADGTLVSTAGIELATSGCRGRSRRAARTAVSEPSLLGGAVTATAVSLAARGDRVHATVEGLRVAGRPIAPAAQVRARIGSWGYAVTGERREVPPARELTSALAVHIIASHAGLPAGAALFIGFVGLTKEPPALAPLRARPKKQPRRARPDRPKNRPQSSHRRRPRRPAHRRQRHRPKRRSLPRRPLPAHRPLKVTPPLGLPGYVFPVAGRASFGDSYGAPRSDVSWHHGDDIFAPLGAPVVAVATGTLNRVGWERLGGWRLWVRDRLGNEFYYAHLSGYTPAALRRKRVKAGEVLGFVGNTGDAFTTPFHLHFEIHPRSLLSLRYDGAVNPTGYLTHWRHLSRVHARRPLHPRLPIGAARAQAVYVFRELLAARGLARPRLGAPGAIPHVAGTGNDWDATEANRHLRKRPADATRAEDAPASTFALEGLALVFAAAPAALGATLLRRSR